MPGVLPFRGGAPRFEQDDFRQDVEGEFGADEHGHADLAGMACGLVEGHEGFHAFLRTLRRSKRCRPQT